MTAINSITEPLSPPMSLQLADVTNEQLIFKWNENVQCSSLRYEINATGCGNCPSHTVNNNVTCRDFNGIGEGLCIFAVKTVVCKSSHESSLNNVTVTLKGSAYYECNNNSCVYYITQNLILILI